MSPDLQLQAILRWVGLLALFFAVVEVGVAAAFGDPSSLLIGLGLGAFAGWIAYASRRMTRAAREPLVTRTSLLLLGLLLLVSILFPTAAIVLVVACFVAVQLALPHLRRRGLRLVMLLAWLSAIVVTTAAEILPGHHLLPPAVASAIRVSAVAGGFGLVTLLLWQFATRLQDAARDLGAVAAMSSDVAQTREPKLVGDRIARHLAQATGFGECVVSEWDHSGHRVITFGYWPPETREVVGEPFDLADYPETRRVLIEQAASVISTTDPLSDPAERALLERQGLQGCLMLPLVAHGHTVGLVELRTDRPMVIEERAFALARMLADEAAVALENARLNDQLRHQAFHDALSGLANRALFRDRVEHALARSSRSASSAVAVLFLDLDDFKTINDRHGHARGDALLQAVARRVERSLRSGDTAARLGGDEFAVLVEDLADDGEAETIAARLVSAMSEPFEVDGAQLRVSASVGVAISPDGGSTADDLLRNADFAMYGAKGAGKGRYQLFRPSLRADASARERLLTRLRASVDAGALALRYQPIVDLASGQTIGVEALVRWPQDDGTMRLPGEFIEAAESSGLIGAIDRWVLQQAASEVAAWNTGGQQVRLSVNVSPQRFAEDDLVDEVRDVLTRTRLAPGSLVLEITERTLMQDRPATIARLSRLRELGVRIAIDDFGTGYSSLGYLERFPVDILKVDRAFVTSLGDDPQRAVLAQAIVQLGHALRLELVAEGIERPQQLEALRELGCQLGQGYLFSPPTTPDVCRRWIAGGAPWGPVPAAA